MFGRYERTEGYDIEWLPWPIILWRLLWFVPTMVLRLAFVGCIFCMHGPHIAKRVYHGSWRQLV